MTGDGKHGEDHADHADEPREVIDDQLTAGAAAPGAPAPTGPRAESLREAVHRRMRELADRPGDEREHTEETSGPDEAAHRPAEGD
ncbi:hypothetical protein GCM10010503_41490 [Streptomyces lucensis JCM 4490]|uniref:Uncharacterized protein n=1 Tax=Streptomyces lucensis JCM 4490 TaxID=1306176 RepID=A0A918J8B1_9ACTN|nr:hypothetical protein [Streptomyces lucensis]GGW59961.1 hypothetical protein GCM10010503_41490 [Streptomyces lucensis JCM 4490]